MQAMLPGGFFLLSQFSLIYIMGKRVRQRGRGYGGTRVEAFVVL